jgi:SHS2 domain-containing protein
MYRFVEHTAELELELEAPTEAALFEEALRALAELTSGDADGTAVHHELELEGEDHALLLVDWLHELIFLAEVEQLVAETVVSLELSGGGLRATVRGRRGHPRHLVKAATLNKLQLRQEGGTWRARLVLDV